ncbi:hypothetical protein F5Y15DRAFT_47359 [Xylariaceae sp. FL0016]|nr:hypothetical protein F5Y15DRAFT_47359 [Xylariaceae sp. FL0016]
MASHPETVAFLGASTGVGLSALKHTLATGRRCIALCRQPSKLSSVLPAARHPGLTIVEGNAKDPAAVSRVLQARPGVLVDAVVTTIGGAPVLARLTIDDPEVCREGMRVLLASIDGLRRDGAAGGRPRIVVGSTTGMSRFGRDVPLPVVPLYHVALRVPHEDKRAMEDRLVASDADFTSVRMSFLTNGATDKTVRVGIEDPVKGRESTAIGYAISREDAGRWIAENLVSNRDERFNRKFVMITT